jgi:hypothetical protein
MAETAVHCSQGVGNCHLQRGQLWASREHSRCSCMTCAGHAILVSSEHRLSTTVLWYLLPCVFPSIFVLQQAQNFPVTSCMHEQVIMTTAVAASFECAYPCCWMLEWLHFHAKT